MIISLILGLGLSSLFRKVCDKLFVLLIYWAKQKTQNNTLDMEKMF